VASTPHSRQQYRAKAQAQLKEASSVVTLLFYCAGNDRFTGYTVALVFGDSYIDLVLTGQILVSIFFI
jgi:hypothetical protein